MGKEQDNDVQNFIQNALKILNIDPSLTNLLLTISSVFFVKGLFVFVSKYWSANMAISLKKTIQQLLSQKYSELYYGHFTGLKTGWLSNILMHESGLFSQGFSEFIRIQTSLIFIFAYIIAATILMPKLTIAISIFGILIFLPMRIIMHKVRNISRNLTAEYGFLNASIVEYADSFPYTKATGSVFRFCNRIKTNIQHVMNLEKRLNFFSALIGTLPELIAVFSLAGLIFTHVVLLNGNLSEIIVVSLLFYRIIGNILNLQGQWQRFNSTFGSIELIENTFNEFELNREPPGKIQLDNLNIPIRFQNVSLTVGNNPILNNVSFCIHPNQTVGIVGPSGAGKSSILKLLTCLLVPTKGKIKFGDLDCRDVNVSSFRKKIGYVPQNPTIISGTLYENINFGFFKNKDKHAIKSVTRVMKLVGLDDMIEQIEKQMGEKGSQISGGQKQRITLARELIREPELLILDEPTSALDDINENLVMKTLNRLKNKKTIVIISHRASSVKNCDNIIVIENGTLLNSGSFEYLKRNCKKFNKLYSRQEI